MATLMARLVVQRPNQQDETFGLVEWELNKNNCVYSYQVTPANELKIYQHKVYVSWSNQWNPDDATAGAEIAHFRPNQWDRVRIG